MNRTSFMATCGLYASVASLVGYSAEKPNIVIVLMDDMGYGEANCFRPLSEQNSGFGLVKKSDGSPISLTDSRILTPNLDKLAADGIRFTDFYAGGPVCGPARASMLQGMNAGNPACSVRNNNTGGFKMRAGDFTIAEMLKTFGYQTGCVGKYGMNGNGPFKVYDDETDIFLDSTKLILPHTLGWDYVYGVLDHQSGHTQFPGIDFLDDPEFGSVGKREQARIFEGYAGSSVPAITANHEFAEIVDTHVYECFQQGLDFSQVRYYEKAEEFIANAKSNNKPFMLYISPTIPHAGWFVPKAGSVNDNVDFSKGLETDQSTPNGTGVGSFKWYIDQFNAKQLSEPTPDPAVYPSGTKWTSSSSSAHGVQSNAFAAYAAMISHVDRDLGKLRNYIKAQGLDDNTIIIFTSDNGPSSEGGAKTNLNFGENKPLRGKKTQLYEGGIRVPTVMYAPSSIMPAEKVGTTSDHIGAFCDIMPSLADFAGIDKSTLPDNIDGKSFASVIDGVSTPESKAYKYFESSKKQAIRWGKWKAIRSDANTPDGNVVLYDLENDLGETTNLAADNVEIVNQMKTFMNESRYEGDSVNNIVPATLTVVEPERESVFTEDFSTLTIESTVLPTLTPKVLNDGTWASPVTKNLNGLSWTFVRAGKDDNETIISPASGRALILLPTRGIHGNETTIPSEFSYATVDLGESVSNKILEFSYNKTENGGTWFQAQVSNEENPAADNEAHWTSLSVPKVNHNTDPQVDEAFTITTEFRHIRFRIWPNGTGAYGGDKDVMAIDNIGLYTPPTAVDDSYEIVKNSQLQAESVLGNDINTTGDAVKESDPANGVLTEFNSDGTFIYNPNIDFYGEDSFNYSVNGSTATVTITVSASQPVKGLDLSGNSAAEVQIVGYKGIPGNTPRTISAWFRSEVGAKNQFFFSYGQTTGASGAILNLGIENSSDGKFRVEFGSGALVGTSKVNDGNWHHVALVMNGDVHTIYVDGNNEGSLTKTVNTSSDLDVYIGNSTNRTRFWNGTVNELRMWDVALTPAQISSMKNTEIDDDNGDGFVDQESSVHWDDLQLYYRFNSLGADGKITDYSRYSAIPDTRAAGERNGTLLSGATLGTGKDLAVPPVVGLEVTQTGTLLTWQVDDEINVKEYQIVNVKTGEVIDTVVAGKSVYSYELEEGEEVKLIVVDKSGFTQEFYPENGNIQLTTYHLIDGWNLIAITGDNAQIKTMNPMWVWVDNHYELTTEVAVCQAVWVYSEEPQTIVVESEKSTTEMSLSTGWNMVGPKENCKIPAAAISVYSWNQVYQEVLKDGVLIEGVGYWIFKL